MYFSGQGKLFLAERDTNGKAKGFVYAGNVPALKVSLSTDTTDHTESHSGQRLADFRLTTSKSAEVQFTLEEWELDNLVTGLYGTKVDPATGAPVTGEDVGTPEKGQYVALKHPMVSAVTISDSASGSLIAGTDYEVNADFGSIHILSDLSSFTPPFSVDYTYAADKGSVSFFTSLAPERWLRFEGLNTADGNKPVLVEVYRALMDPMSELDLINDDLLKLDITGSALYDEARGNDPAMGNFGRIVFVR